MNTSIVDLLEAYPLPEQDSKPEYQIYCDMDGVLADFKTGHLRITGITINKWIILQYRRDKWSLNTANKKTFTNDSTKLNNIRHSKLQSKIYCK